MTQPASLLTARRTVEAFSITKASLLDGTVAAAETRMWGVRTGSLTPDATSVDNTGDDRVQSTWNIFNFANVNIQGGFIPFEFVAKIQGSTIDVGGDPTPATLKFTPAATGGAGVGDSFDYSGPATVTFTVDGTSVTLDADYGTLAGVVAAVDGDLGAGYTVTAEGSRVVITTTATGAAATIALAGADATAISGGPAYSLTAGSNGNRLSLPLWPASASNQPAWPVVLRMLSKDRRKTPLIFDFVLYQVQFGPISFDGPAYRTGLTFSAPGRALLSDFDEVGNELPEPTVGRMVSDLPA